MNRAQILSALPGGLVAAVLLLLQLPADPSGGLTFSESPWTDEAWSVVGARNLVLLGTWTTDELALHLVQLPYQLALTVVFEAFGVGIVQARALSVALTVGAVVLTALTTTRHFGAVAGTVAGVGLAASPLTLYYGRLAYLEPMVTLCLTAGAAVLLARPGLRPVVAGAAAGACLALAIGTKPSAIAAVAGILVGCGIGAGGRLPGVRATLVVGVSVIVVAAVGWATLIGLPQREAIETVFRFWPAQPLPETLVDWVVRVGRYVRASDGANLLTLPLIVGGVAGTLLALRRWHTLEPGQRMLVGAAAGWVVLGMLLIVLSAYRPNRYVVPLLPALAMLSGVAAGLMLERLQPRRTFASAAAVAAVMAAPGLVLWAGWQASATHRLPAIQAQVAQVIGAQGAVEGGVGVGFAMRAPVPTIVSRSALGINAGDLYAAHGVRWIVADDGYQPTWAGAHPEAWRAREVVACFVWGPDGTECLIRLP